MVNNLKDALQKIGLHSTKDENSRKKTSGRDIKNSERYQMDRNFCEVCNSHQRDVERYKHRNRLLDAEWMCVVCADKEMIDDNFRITNQSEVAKSNAFMRNYGATKKFEVNHDKKVKKSSNTKTYNKNNNGNY